MDNRCVIDGRIRFLLIRLSTLDLLDLFLFCSLLIQCLLPCTCLCVGPLRLILGQLGSRGRNLFGKFARGLCNCLGCNLGLLQALIHLPILNLLLV
ncbi:hypothetical protein D7Y51_09665 [Stenotrophomonas maltophilia]|nr:hypothetical protein AR275_27260 [Stenotrophomonas maltophilia]MBA0443362.1 hypothetical protein [Stenotrophomonas maltophilia]